MSWAALALMLVFAGPAVAQASKPESAEAAAAMERAQRLASNPMRVILEASKFRRKGSADADAAPDAADAANLRRTVARTGAAESTALAAPREEAVITPRSAPVPVPKAAAVAPVPSVPTVLLTTSSMQAAPVAAMVQALEGAKPMSGMAALPTSAAPLASLVATLVRPKLLSSPEPVFTGRLLEDAARLTEVSADLTLLPNGSVGAVSVLTPMPRPLQRAIVVAMEQWRFEPLAATRVHRVQLVFNEQK